MRMCPCTFFINKNISFHLRNIFSWRISKERKKQKWPRCVKLFGIRKSGLQEKFNKAFVCMSVYLHERIFVGVTDYFSTSSCLFVCLVQLIYLFVRLYVCLSTCPFLVYLFVCLLHIHVDGVHYYCTSNLKQFPTFAYNASQLLSPKADECNAGNGLFIRFGASALASHKL